MHGPDSRESFRHYNWPPVSGVADLSGRRAERGVAATIGNGLVLDSPLDSLSQIAPGRCYASLEEDFSKDVELGPAERISASPEEDQDHVGGLSPLLSIRWRQAPLIPSKAAQAAKQMTRSETDDTRVAHALSPTQETIIPPDLISTTVSKGQTGGAQGGRQKGGCRAS